MRPFTSFVPVNILPVLTHHRQHLLNMTISSTNTQHIASIQQHNKLVMQVTCSFLYYKIMRRSNTEGDLRKIYNAKIRNGETSCKFVADLCSQPTKGAKSPTHSGHNFCQRIFNTFLHPCNYQPMSCYCILGRLMGPGAWVMRKNYTIAGNSLAKIIPEPRAKRTLVAD